jgi:hypothetical protein
MEFRLRPQVRQRRRKKRIYHETRKGRKQEKEGKNS